MALFSWFSKPAGTEPAFAALVQRITDLEAINKQAMLAWPKLVARLDALEAHLSMIDPSVVLEYQASETRLQRMIDQEDGVAPPRF